MPRLDDRALNSPLARRLHRRALAVMLCGFVAAACASDAAARKQEFVARGDGFAAAGRFREAVIEYRNAVQLDPMFAEARVKLAKGYEELGDAGGALREYVRAADLLPQDIELQETAVGYLIAARRLDDAVARVDALLALDPNNVEAHVLKGNALGGLNNLEQALAEMEEALRLDPARGATHAQIGLVEAARGRHAEAETAFKRAIELAPEWVGGRLALANYYWATRRYADAAAALEVALQLAPDDEAANHTMAIFSLATGRIVEAERYLKQLATLSRTSASKLVLADYYIATGRAKDAVAIIEPLMSQAESRLQARQAMARALAADGDGTRATALADELIAEFPNDVEVQLLKAGLLLHDGRRDEALAPVRAAVAAEPRSAAAQYMLGRVLAARGDPEAAASAFREVLDINPAAAAARTELAVLELSTGTVAASLASAEAAVKTEPARLDARLALIRGLLASRAFDRAENELRALVSTHGDVAAVRVQEAVLLASRNDVSGARAAFEKALSMDPRSLEALGGLLALDLNARDFAAARERINLQLAAGPASPQLLILAARTLGSAGDLPGAERVLRQAVESNATLLPAYEMLGQIYLRQNRLDDARREFEMMASKQANPAGALTMVGMIFQAQEDARQARLTYERAVAADPKAVVAANNLAWMYLEANERLQEALRLAQVAAELSPDDPEILDTLGWAYYKNGLASVAIAPLVRAVSASPDNGAYLFHLGLAYEKSGDFSKAQQVLHDALKRNGDARWAAEARRTVIALEKRGGR